MGKSSERNYIHEIQNLTNKLIRKANTNYYTKLGNKLSDPKIGQKTYWTAFKRIVNKKNIPKFPFSTNKTTLFQILNRKLKCLMIS